MRKKYQYKCNWPECTLYVHTYPYLYLLCPGILINLGTFLVLSPQAPYADQAQEETKGPFTLAWWWSGERPRSITASLQQWLQVGPQKCGAQVYRREGSRPPSQPLWLGVLPEMRVPPSSLCCLLSIKAATAQSRAALLPAFCRPCKGSRLWRVRDPRCFPHFCRMVFLFNL